MSATGSGDDGLAAEIPSAAEASGAPRERVDLDAELTRCEHGDLYMEVPMSSVAPYVPEDFEIPTAGVGPDGGPLAMAFVGMLRCERFAAAGFEGRGDFGWLDVAVAPKHESMRDASRTIYLLRLEHYVLAGPLQEAQALLGDRHVVAEGIEFAASLTGASFSIVAGDVALQASAPTSGLAPSGAFKGVGIREFGFAEGGYSYVDLTVSPQSATMGLAPGSVTTSPGSLAEKVLGPRASGTLATAMFDFVDGGMGFIPAP